jgi:microcin C transport system substrate-binding protein
MHIAIRGALRGLALSLALAAASLSASAQEPRHAIAMYGEPKYGPDFKHFDYVNPDAPKGGELRQGSPGTFDSFNAFIARGTPASTGSVETLLVSSADEAFTEYGLLAETVEVPEDRSWVIFNLRPEARWHDGRPVTAEDVAFSLETLKTKGHPRFRFYYQSIAKAEILGERKVKFTFAEGDNRELPLIAGQLPILPKHYWETRDFTKTTLEPPLGSGPYRIASFEQGRFIVQERVPDYWGRNLAVRIGQNNFDRIRIDYFRDETVLRQAVKSGLIDMRMENQAKAWALDYDVPAVQLGLLKKQEFPHERPTGMQGFVMNTRRAPFDNKLVRQALAYAFDFEWTNRNLFFGLYSRTRSYFSNSELASRGLPGGEELAILERYRGRVPDEVFTREYQPPSTDGDGWPRGNLATAFALLEKGGWVVRDMRLVNAETGEPMRRLEILIVSQAFERIVLPFTRNLKRLGIDASVRFVDAAQYVNRERDFDFDMLIQVWGQSNSPGNEQRDYWGSEAASTPGSENLAGIRDPVVDEMIDLVISAPDRPGLVARTRALDRVLLWGHYVVPNWHSRVDRILYWDKFEFPKVIPDSGTSTSFWWFNPGKETQVAQSLASHPEATRPEATSAETTSRPERKPERRTGGVLWMAALAALLLAGYLMVRRAMRKGRP